MEIRQYVTVGGRSVFQDWFDGLRDINGKVAITRRLNRIALHDHLGDVKAVGEGVCELRFDVGPGYRVYFALDGNAVVLLLCGGGKDSQQRDIERAQGLWRDYQMRNKP